MVVATAEPWRNLLIASFVLEEGSHGSSVSPTPLLLDHLLFWKQGVVLCISDTVAPARTGCASLRSHRPKLFKEYAACRRQALPLLSPLAMPKSSISFPSQVQMQDGLM
jgi:hypothetical protein